MKALHIPKGQTVRYKSLAAENLVVDGCLEVANGIKAKNISGNGVICAGSVCADHIHVDELETAYVVCDRLIAKRVQAPEVFASESATVTSFLSAAYVETGKLTAAISEIDEVRANEIIKLEPTNRSLLGTLLLAGLREFWARLTAAMAQSTAVDANFTPVDESDETEDVEPVDEELNRIIGLYKLSKDSGYTLKLVPGTPEENAPVFDFENEQILRPAA